MRIGDWSSDVCSSDLSTVWPALPGAIVPTAVSLVISKATSAPVVADPSPSPVEVQYAKAAPAPARVRTAASASATLFLRRDEMVAMRAPLIGVHVACSLDAFTEGTAPRTGATERRLPHKRGRTYSACPRRDDTGGTRLAKPCETIELPQN